MSRNKRKSYLAADLALPNGSHTLQTCTEALKEIARIVERSDWLGRQEVLAAIEKLKQQQREEYRKSPEYLEKCGGYYSPASRRNAEQTKARAREKREAKEAELIARASRVNAA